MAHMASTQRRPVVFAMVSALTSVGGAFQSVVNFVLYKPLAYEQVARSLHAGQRYMKTNPRHATRHQLETLVYLRFGAKALPAIVLDLSEQGLALQAPEPLPPVENVPLRFVLPGTTHLVEAMGKVIWSDDDGRAGVFFSRLSPASRQHLKSWLAKRGVKARMLYACSCHRKGRGVGRTRHTEDDGARDFQEFYLPAAYSQTRKPAKPIAMIRQVTVQVNVNRYKKLPG